MLPVLWLESADTDLDDITSYIARFDIDAAERLWQRLRGCVLPLSNIRIYTLQATECQAYVRLWLIPIT